MIVGTVQIPNICITGMTGPKAWDYAEHAVIEGKKRRQFVAVDAVETTISAFLHVDLGVIPDDVVGLLEELADATEVLTLQSESGRIFGDYVITGVESTPVWQLPDGSVIACRLVVKLVEPGLEQVLVPPAPIAVTTTTRDTTTTPKGEDTSRDPDDVPTAEIARI